MVTHGFERYLGDKRAQPATGDPVGDLRRGWDLHIEFGRTHPALYALMYGIARQGGRPAAAGEAYKILLGLLDRVAKAGLLRVPAETAAAMVHSAGVGVTLTLITDPDGTHEDLSARTREAVLAAITTSEGEHSPAALPARAIALGAALDAGNPLSAAENALLREWLERLARS